MIGPSQIVKVFRANRTGHSSRFSHNQWSKIGINFYWVLFFLFGVLGFPSPSWGQPVPPGTIQIEEDIAATRHNFSATSQEAEDVTSSTSEICVFCHTPHGGSSTGTALEAPLWNRNLDYDRSSYVLYDQVWSFSFEGTLDDTKPTGYSRLCLSCHDDLIAIGSVVNSVGSGGYFGQTPAADSLGIGIMSSEIHPAGSGDLTGDTRVLGTNLQNDHPISFLYDSTLAAFDAELTDPGPIPTDLNAVTNLAPAGGYQTGVKRYGNTATPGVFNSVQCTSCHNPHATTYPKFLRAPRLQDAGESGFLPGGLPASDHTPGQIICLYCHTKPGWNNSTHDISTAIHETYPVDIVATSYDEAGYDFDGIHTVGEYACRNCHDPHTAQGAKRLHREGVTAFGGSSAIENTCYLCHSANDAPNTLLPIQPDEVWDGSTAQPVSGANPRFATSGVGRIAPDIYSEFSKDNSACAGGSGGGGSGMCLQLATGHEPVFVSRPQEGVQVKSEGLGNLEVPSSNEETPGIATVDPTHVECVDCHNPHQVNSPHAGSLSYNGAPNPPSGVGSADAQGDGGRFKGMKGVGIDSSGTRPIVIGKCEAGFVICGTETTINLKHPLLAAQSSANRDPYVYEICFRCHGMSYKRVFSADGTGVPGLLNPDDSSAFTIAEPLYVADPTIRAFALRTDKTHGESLTQYSFKGFSNKWLEFNPETDDLDSPEIIKYDALRFGQSVPSHTQQSKNPAYHPVVLPGRNGSWQLCNQLTTAFQLDCGSGPGALVAAPGNPAAAQTALGNLTIQCTDCHNNNAYDAYGGATVLGENAYNAGVDGSAVRGPLTESNLRPTDVWPDLTPGAAAYSARVSQPIGPHGSIFQRLLRGNYDTDILAPGRCFAEGNPAGCSDGDGYVAGAAATHAIAGGGGGSDNSHFGQFLLCFNCHDRRGFDPDAGTDSDRQWTRFFGLNTSAGVDSWWNGNLHMYHLRWTGAMCHECHYNIHSNVQAINTIYGDGRGGQLPDDAEDGMDDGVIGTHLINFSPMVEGTVDIKPKWFYDGSAFRCYMRCHNEIMNSCAYQATSTGTPDARWCAGGRNPGTSG